MQTEEDELPKAIEAETQTEVELTGLDPTYQADQSSKHGGKLSSQLSMKLGRVASQEAHSKIQEMKLEDADEKKVIDLSEKIAMS